jgi:hypothetical protein
MALAALIVSIVSIVIVIVLAVRQERWQRQAFRHEERDRKEGLKLQRSGVDYDEGGWLRGGRRPPPATAFRRVTRYARTVLPPALKTRRFAGRFESRMGFSAFLVTRKPRDRHVPPGEDLPGSLRSLQGEAVLAFSRTGSPQA